MPRALVSFKAPTGAIFAKDLDLAQCAVGTTISISGPPPWAQIEYAILEVIHCHEVHHGDGETDLVVCTRMLNDFAEERGQWTTWSSAAGRRLRHEQNALNQAWILAERARLMREKGKLEAYMQSA